MGITKPKKTRKAIFSCDRCKSKKRKCVRLIGSGPEKGSLTFDIAYPCTECLKSKSICHTTLAERKYVQAQGTRWQPGSDSESQKKIEMLSRIVQRLCPGKDINTLNDLSHVMEGLGMDLPAHQEVLPQEKHTDMQDEAVVFDSEGRSHYIGPLGSPLIHESILGMIKKEPTQASDASIKSLALKEQHEKFALSVPMVDWIEREEADHYVRTYFERVHPVYNCIDQGEFTRYYELFWILLRYKEIETVNYSTFLESAQVCVIYLVWILGRLYDITEEKPGQHLNEALIHKYVSLSQSLLSEAILRPSVACIQMILLLSMYLETNNSKESACILLKLAGSQAVSMGMNKDIRSIFKDFSLRSQHLYSRIWWTIFCNEVRLSNVLGRPSSVDIQNFDVKYPSAYKYMPEKTGYWDAPYNYEVYFEKSCDLHKILYRITELKNSMSRGASMGVGLTAAIERATAIRSELSTWRRSLPDSLKEPVDSPPEMSPYFKIQLHLNFHHYFVQFGIPFLFLLLRILRTDEPSRITSSSPILTFSISAINCSKQLYNIAEFEYSNRIFNGSLYNDLDVVYNGVMVLSIALILLTHRNSKSSLDLAYMEKRKDITVEHTWNILCKIEELNTHLQGMTHGSMAAASESIANLMKDMHEFVDTKRIVQYSWFSNSDMNRDLFDVLSGLPLDEDSMKSLLGDIN